MVEALPMGVAIVDLPTLFCMSRNWRLRVFPADRGLRRRKAYTQEFRGTPGAFLEIKFLCYF